EKDKKQVAINKRNHGHDKRYSSFNFHSTFYRGTLEVRAHSATQNPQKILNWIELLLKVVDWSLNHYKHSQVEKLLELDGATCKKVHKMKKLFKFSKKIENYICSRIRYFKHDGLKIGYSLGALPKQKLKTKLNKLKKENGLK
ncbi:MAG: amidoligase family protein, partial [Nanoarchaeota archaeon]